MIEREGFETADAGRGDEPLLGLSGRARDLLRILDDKGAAASLYIGALRVLADGANPAGVRQAAYALRELIDELEKAAGLELKGRQLGERVRQLCDEWRRTPRMADGAISSGAPGIATSLDEFFDWYEAELPTRRGRAHMTLRGLDPAQRDPPPVVRDARAKSLMRFRDDFNNILHGHYSPSAAEFRTQHIDSFETFLLDWFRPRTFADFDAIDKLLEDGPPSG